MKGIELCADCAYYSMKTHKCGLGCTIEPDLEKGEDVRFFVDCLLPEVQEIRHGRWINVIGDDYECSECKAAVWSRNTNPIENYHYCWRCGAKMDDAKPIKG